LSEPRRLAALVVNYNTGAFAEGCVRSLARAWEQEGRRRDDLDIVVVDNASPLDQSEHLERLERMGARVLRSPTNGGYAGGANLAYRETRGAPDDAVALLNPDLCFLPRTIGPLLDHLARHPECGVVAPRTTIDLAGELHISRDLLPTPLEQARTTLARMSPFWCRRYGARRLRLALEWWTSSEPLETDMITGCALFLRRSVVDAEPYFLDERFPLYFEDTDLYHRLRRKGLSVVRHGGVRILHHWSRSAGVGPQFQGEPLRRYWISFEHYFRKYYGALGLGFVHGLAGLERRWPPHKLHRPMHALESLGELDAPVEIRLPGRCRYVLELGLAPTWIVTVGVVQEGDRWRCPAETWQWFFEGDYFVRGFDRDTRAFLGAWHFRKRGPGRTRPLEIAEIESGASGRVA
jgi:GT2 family glycosyltransferase